MIKRFSFIMLIFLLLLGGCASAAQDRSRYEEAPAAPGAPAYDEASYDYEQEEMAAQEPGSGNSQSNGDRLVIRNANLTIVVDDPGQAMSQVSRMAESMGGFVVSSNLYKTFSNDDREIPEANITVRVPAEQLNNAMDQIKALVEDPTKDVRAETISGQDVTREYTDLNSRLTNLEQTEKQLREIMGSATKTEDVLAIHQQLSQIRSEIEVIKGQMQYYREAAALSSISVVIKSQESVQPLEIGGWQPVGVARDAVQAMIDSMQFIGSIVIWLVLYVLPIGLVIFIPLRLLWIVFRRSSKNRRENTPAAPPTTPQS